jgi:hypothetical protein
VPIIGVDPGLELPTDSNATPKSSLRTVSRKREGAHLVPGFVHDADLPLAIAPEFAAEVSQHLARDYDAFGARFVEAGKLVPSSSIISSPSIMWKK